MRRPELPASVIERRAIVYVRQSTLVQVEENLESQRRQYELAGHARDLGFRDIVVIDDDLGVSASGTSARPGFESMVAQICQGIVGGVFCLEASRLARNGRDWHHLLELCGLVGARVFDVDGVYDPGLPNDRLLLGLKGTMSEFELTVMRRRLLDAALAKARRGELRFGVPVGLVWERDGKITTVRTSGGQRLVPAAEVARLLAERRAVGPQSGVSRRNAFPGVITKVTRDKVSALVEIQAGPHRIVSLITREAADELALEPGNEAVATVKATSVMVEVPR